MFLPSFPAFEIDANSTSSLSTKHEPCPAPATDDKVATLIKAHGTKDAFSL